MVKKILIVEDEPSMARALEMKLTQAGFAVRSVANGAIGLKLLEQETVDLVLLDIIMPKVDGFKVLEILKHKGITMPVIVLSNLGHSDDEKHVKALGVKEFFIKSNTPIATIVERVRQLLT